MQLFVHVGIKLPGDDCIGCRPSNADEAGNHVSVGKAQDLLRDGFLIPERNPHVAAIPFGRCREPEVLNAAPYRRVAVEAGKVLRVQDVGLFLLQRDDDRRRFIQHPVLLGNGISVACFLNRVGNEGHCVHVFFRQVLRYACKYLAQNLLVRHDDKMPVPEVVVRRGLERGLYNPPDRVLRYGLIRKVPYTVPPVDCIV